MIPNIIANSFKAAFSSKIFLFGNKYSGKDVSVIKEISIPLYVYRFITENNQELILFSTTQCEIGDYVVEGVMTQCDDFRMLTDTAKLPTKCRSDSPLASARAPALCGNATLCPLLQPRAT